MKLARFFFAFFFIFP
ncbi:hypothetical protein E2X65_20995 [Salmonella enterica]|nr:hypothetical protein [Salmonella enterica]